MNEQVAAAYPGERRQADSQLISMISKLGDDIKSVRDEIRQDMIAIDKKLDNTTSQTMDIKLAFGSYSAKMDEKVSNLDSSVGRAWQDINKLQIQAGQIEAKIENHLIATVAKRETTKGTAEWVKWLVGILFGSGLVFVVIKLASMGGA
jgi:hypothetical protein